MISFWVICRFALMMAYTSFADGGRCPSFCTGYSELLFTAKTITHG